MSGIGVFAAEGNAQSADLTYKLARPSLSHHRPSAIASFGFL
jgi:hypothetical protein